MAALAPPAPAWAADGYLDITFDGDGIKKSLPAFPRAAVIQPDGKILAAGFTGDNRMFVARFLPNGDLDTAGFAALDLVPGIAYVNFSSWSQAFAVALSPDGGIVLAGSESGGTGALAVLTPLGALDTGFSGDGKLTHLVGNVTIYTAVAVQPDGKIVAAGYTWSSGSPTSYDFLVTRFEANGALDSSFGSGGYRTIDFGGGDRAACLALQPDGKIVVAGYTDPDEGTSGDQDFAVARLTTTGALDATFDSDGKVIVSFVGDDQCRSVLVDRQGRVLLGGYSGIGAHHDFYMVRLLTGGGYDGDFGSSGKTGLSFLAYSRAHIEGLAVQANGKILAGGWLADVDGNNPRYCLTRFLPNGSVDSATFNPGGGDAGFLVPDLSGDATCYALAYHPIHRAVLAGHSLDLGGGPEIALVRIATGNPAAVPAGNATVIGGR